MNIAAQFYCRTVQLLIYIVSPLLPYRTPKLLDGLDSIPDLLKEEKRDRVLLVTDENIRRLGLTEGLEEALEKAGIACHVYDKVLPNPTTVQVEECRRAYLEGDCQGIIAFGGGSPMDCAKATAARIARPRRSTQKLKGLFKVMRRTPPVIAVPTTAGSGSETTLSAVITDAETHHKYVINDFALIPKYAVLDPKVMATLPRETIAITGMDALTHAVEAYISLAATKKSEADAMEAVILIYHNLEKAYETGDEEACRNLLIASHLAGRAFTRSYVGYVHALAHALGGAYNIPHGLANAVLLPNVLASYGAEAVPRLSKLADPLGFHCNKDSIRARGFVDLVRRMNEKMGIPSHIEALQVEDIPRLARQAAAEANPLYPVPKLWCVRELEAVYYSVLA